MLELLFSWYYGLKLYCFLFSRCQLKIKSCLPVHIWSISVWGVGRCLEEYQGWREENSSGWAWDSDTASPLCPSVSKSSQLFSCWSLVSEESHWQTELRVVERRDRRSSSSPSPSSPSLPPRYQDTLTIIIHSCLDCYSVCLCWAAAAAADGETCAGHLAVRWGTNSYRFVCLLQIYSFIHHWIRSSFNRFLYYSCIWIHLAGSQIWIDYYFTFMKIIWKSTKN